MIRLLTKAGKHFKSYKILKVTILYPKNLLKSYEKIAYSSSKFMKIVFIPVPPAVCVLTSLLTEVLHFTASS